MDGMLSQEEINALLGNLNEVLPLLSQMELRSFLRKRRMQSVKSPISVWELRRQPCIPS